MEEGPLNLFLFVFSSIEFHLLNVNVFLSLLAILLLLVSSAFISGSEVAYFSLTSAELEDIDDEKVCKLLEKPNELLATILIVNNFINVGIVVISAYFTSIAISFPEDSRLEFVFQIIIIASLLVLLGEIMPKVYANNNPVKFSLRMSKILTLLKELYIH